MSATIRRYIAERENFQFNRGLNQIQLAASKLRQNFLKKFIIGFDTNLYKTQEQRDWAYIAKRQYRYDVQLTGIGYSLMAALLVYQWRTFVNKRAVFWPFFVVTTLTYQYVKPSLLQKHSKKFFDMCNLGEDYYLGQKRNQVLRQCNRLLGVEDF